MKKEPGIFIEHILECIGLIESYTEAETKETFLVSKQMQDAVIRRIEIIGEAVKNIPEQFKQTHTGIPWKRIAGMRDILIHEYFSVDLNLTWRVATTEIHNLRSKMLAIRDALDTERCS